MRYWGLLVSLATVIVGLLFPAYKSVEALESSATLDDSQWLFYWLISAFITIVERFGGKFLFKLPLYGEAKLALLCWLALPFFNGASLLYEWVRPHILDLYQSVRSNAQEVQGKKDDDALVKSRERVAQVRVNVIKRLNDLYIEAQSTGSTSALDSKLDSYEEVTASS